jgi:hypothetical protein
VNVTSIGAVRETPTAFDAGTVACTRGAVVSGAIVLNVNERG